MKRGREQARGGRGGMGGKAAIEKNNANGELEIPESGDSRSGESAMDTRGKVFSWFDIIRAGAQLTLDVLRVIRETTDLYRKLSTGKD